MRRQRFPWAYVLAACAGLPLFAPEVWSGFRLAAADPLLAAIAPGEQPLSVRSPGGEWAMLLALAWFGLAYWRRNVRAWEIALILVGGAAALVRAGNMWIDALALVAPLGRQLSLLRLPTWPLVAGSALATAVTAVTLYTIRPPALPAVAVTAVQTADARGNVLSDWRWAATLEGDLGGRRRVFAAGGLASETPDFWLRYLRVVQDHEQWPSDLTALDASILVLDSHDASLAHDVRASPDWRVLYDSGNALVAGRATP
jgi:hypothetical protein